MYSGTYRAVCPGLKRAVVARLDGLDGHVLVSAEGCDDCRLVRKRDAVSGVRREEALEEGGRRVKDGCTLAADLDADGDLLKVDEIRVDASDMGGRGWVKVEVAKVLAELVRLNLPRDEIVSRAVECAT